MAEIDLFERTLRCHPQPEKVKEVEIVEEPSEEIAVEEEEIVEDEETIDPKVVMQELNCMKRHIQMLQLHLKIDMSECPAVGCIDPEVLLSCSENKEICELQKNHSRLQYQINELVKCCYTAKNHIDDLENRLCERTKDIIRLQKRVDELMQWRNTLDHEFAKCLERFEYLKHVKVEWQEITDKFDDQNKRFDTIEKDYMPKECFIKEKQSFTTEISDLKNIVHELFKYLTQRFECIEERIPATVRNVN